MIEPRPIRPRWIPPAGKGIENTCNACGGDLTGHCFGALIPPGVLQGTTTPGGRMPVGAIVSTGLLLIQPLRCPYCKSPMFYQETQHVLRPLS